MIPHMTSLVTYVGTAMPLVRYEPHQQKSTETGFTKNGSFDQKIHQLPFFQHRITVDTTSHYNID